MSVQEKPIGKEQAGVYADLILYGGFCPSDDMEEGLFTADAADGSLPLSLGTAAVALKKVRYYLDNNDGLQIRIPGSFGVAKTEADAKRLVSYATNTFTDASEEIDLHGILHGEIKFSRMIRLKGMDEKDLGSIVRKMAESGYLPYTREDLARGGWNYDEIGDDAFKRHNERLWKDALFFSTEQAA